MAMGLDENMTAHEVQADVHSTSSEIPPSIPGDTDPMHTIPLRVFEPTDS